jgi:hypothetical protein
MSSSDLWRKQHWLAVAYYRGTHVLHDCIRVGVETLIHLPYDDFAYDVSRILVECARDRSPSATVSKGRVNRSRFVGQLH